MLSWRDVADWAKRRPEMLRLADGLGRGRGRLRFVDRIFPPPRPRFRPDLSDWAQRDLSVVWLGHATILLRIGGKTILTDPVMSYRIGVGLGILTVGPKRLVAPALAVDELPQIDLILISHAHFDHLDRPTLTRLHKSTPVITAGKTRDLIADLGFVNVNELPWGQQLRLGPVMFTAVEVKHWGVRTFQDTYRGYNAYLIEAGDRRVFFSGDTAYRRFGDMGPMDLAILGIGAYDPYIQAHATPEQAWQMFEQLGAQWLLPMHHSTFRLSHEPLDEPIRRLLQAAGSERGRVVIDSIGQQWTRSAGQKKVQSGE